MHVLTMNECMFVVGGQQAPAGGTNPGGTAPTNPMSPGSGSTTDQAVTNFQNGNWFSGLGTMADNPFTILGNGIDGARHAIGDWWNDVTRDPHELGPPDENGVRRSRDGTRVQVPIERGQTAEAN